MSATKTVQYIQEHLRIEQDRKPHNGVLTVPAELIARFNNLRRTPNIEPQFIAGVLLDPPTGTTDEHVEARARRLQEADTYLRSHREESVLHVNSIGLNAGRGRNANHGLTVFGQGDSIDYSSGLNIPTQTSLSANFGGSTHGFGLEASFAQDGQLSFFMPKNVITDGTVEADMDLVQVSTLAAGVLAVGEKAVAGLFAMLREQGSDVQQPNAVRAVAMAETFMALE